MNVKTAGIADIFPPGGKIEAIQEDGPEFRLQFEDGSTVTPTLARPWQFATKITGSSISADQTSNREPWLMARKT